MKISNLKKDLEYALFRILKLEFDFEDGIIANTKEPIKAINEIRKIGILDNNYVYSNCLNEFIQWSGDIYDSSHNSVRMINDDIEMLKAQISMSINVLDLSTPKNDGFLLNIKLPNEIKVKDFPVFYKDINFVLESLLADLDFYFEDIYKLHSIENGSFWNDISIKKREAVFIITAMFSIAMNLNTNIAEVNLKKAEMEKINAEIKALNPSNPNFDEATKMQMEYFEKNKDSYYENGIDELLNTMDEYKIDYPSEGDPENNEYRVKIRKSFERVIKLQDEGTEFFIEVSEEEEQLIELGFSKQEIKQLKNKSLQIKEQTENDKKYVLIKEKLKELEERQKKDIED